MVGYIARLSQEEGILQFQMIFLPAVAGLEGGGRGSALCGLTLQHENSALYIRVHGTNNFTILYVCKFTRNTTISDSIFYIIFHLFCLNLLEWKYVICTKIETMRTPKVAPSADLKSIYKRAPISQPSLHGDIFLYTMIMFVHAIRVEGVNQSQPVEFEDWKALSSEHLCDETVLWRIESGSCAERNPLPIDDDYINVFPDLLCQLIVFAHWIKSYHTTCTYIIASCYSGNPD
jgi:hypothetical protein